MVMQKLSTKYYSVKAYFKINKLVITPWGKNQEISFG